MTSNRSDPAARRIAVVGGGWAGLACAVRLAGHGLHVELFEATRTLGGRARRVDLGGITFDNGQHILIGAYRASLALLRRVGVSDDALVRMPLALECPGQFRFAAAHLPAPLHILAGLAQARGISRHDKLALARWMLTLRLTGFRAPADATVAQWTARLPEPVRRWLIDPLCLSALNTPPALACARTFAAVLRDSLGSTRVNSDLVFARDHLGSLLPDAAAAWIAAQGGRLFLGTPIERIEMRGTHWHLNGSGIAYDAVVLAAPPWRTRELLAALGEAALAPTITALDAFRYEPITTVYLRPTEPMHLPSPMIALAQDLTLGALGQFAFDRSVVGGPWGWLAVVVSAASTARDTPNDALVAGCARQIGNALGRTIEIAEARVITERRATYQCTPGLCRPANELPLPALLLAGDYTAGPYPATLEQAVRSGEHAAELLLVTRS